MGAKAEGPVSANADALTAEITSQSHGGWARAAEQALVWGIIFGRWEGTKGGRKRWTDGWMGGWAGQASGAGLDHVWECIEREGNVGG